MLNRATLIGRLGKDPDTKQMKNGKAVSNFSIATSEKWKDKNTKEWVEKTDWHNIVVYERLAEICQQYLKKGSLVFVEGKIRTRSWEQNGEKKYMTEILVNNMKMLDGKKNSGQSQGGGQSYNKPQNNNNYDDDDMPF